MTGEHDLPRPGPPVGRLYGFGYATLEGSEALAALLGDQVSEVIDVRIRRWSGNRPFSTGTARTVEAAGYAYQWLPGLGNAGHGGHGPMRLAQPSQLKLVLGELRAGRNVALMCACTNPQRCHRRLIVELARKAIPDLEVRELAPAAKASFGNAT